MGLTKEEIERLHDQGKMPDWIYYQVNGKSATENFDEQRRKIYDNLRKREEEKQQKQKLEKELQQLLEATLNDLLKDFK